MSSYSESISSSRIGRVYESGVDSDAAESVGNNVDPSLAQSALTSLQSTDHALHIEYAGLSTQAQLSLSVGIGAGDAAAGTAATNENVDAAESDPSPSEDSFPDVPAYDADISDAGTDDGARVAGSSVAASASPLFQTAGGQLDYLDSLVQGIVDTVDQILQLDPSASDPISTDSTGKDTPERASRGTSTNNATTESTGPSQAQFDAYRIAFNSLQGNYRLARETVEACAKDNLRLLGQLNAFSSDSPYIAICAAKNRELAAAQADIAALKLKCSDLEQEVDRKDNDRALMMHHRDESIRTAEHYRAWVEYYYGQLECITAENMSLRIELDEERVLSGRCRPNA